MFNFSYSILKYTYAAFVAAYVQAVYAVHV